MVCAPIKPQPPVTRIVCIKIFRIQRNEIIREKALDAIEAR
jgi:hypothetical protein